MTEKNLPLNDAELDQASGGTFGYRYTDKTTVTYHCRGCGNAWRVEYSGAVASVATPPCGKCGSAFVTHE